jgi:hypothetical protein
MDSQALHRVRDRIVGNRTPAHLPNARVLSRIWHSYSAGDRRFQARHRTYYHG